MAVFGRPWLLWFKMCMILSDKDTYIAGSTGTILSTVIEDILVMKF